MTNFFIPFFVLIVIFYGLLKKIDIYDSFLKGVREGISLALTIFPVMFAMVMCVDILVKSNFLLDFVKIIGPILEIFKFPKELLPLAIMRSVSGSSSLILMNDIFMTYGADSYLGRVASVIQGSTDTTIYILGLYFASIKIKKTKYALIAGLFADFVAIVLSIVVVNMLF